MKRRTAVLAVLSLVLAGCGEKKNTLAPSPGSGQSFTVMLDWFPNADHVGIYQALANGDFENAGLDVHVQVPSDPSTPLRVEVGKDAALVLQLRRTLGDTEFEATMREALGLTW